MQLSVFRNAHKHSNQKKLKKRLMQTSQWQPHQLAAQSLYFCMTHFLPRRGPVPALKLEHTVPPGEQPGSVHVY